MQSDSKALGCDVRRLDEKVRDLLSVCYHFSGFWDRSARKSLRIKDVEARGLEPLSSFVCRFVPVMSVVVPTESILLPERNLLAIGLWVRRKE
jgi:hypothetical protein